MKKEKKYSVKKVGVECMYDVRSGILYCRLSEVLRLKGRRGTIFRGKILRKLLASGALRVVPRDIIFTPNPPESLWKVGSVEIVWCEPVSGGFALSDLQKVA